MQLTKHWAATLDDYVIDLAWAPDSSQLAAASASGPILLFAAADGAKRHELPGHGSGTNAVAFAPTLRRTEDRGQTAARAVAPSSVLSPQSSAILASGGQDGAVKLWDAAAGQHVATASLGSAWVDHLAWGPGLTTEDGGETAEGGPVLAAASGRNLILLNPDGTLRHSFQPAPKTITALAWQPATGRQTTDGGGRSVSSNKPSPDLRHPASVTLAAAYFGGVCLWNTREFSSAKEFAYNNGIHALAWSPDGRWLVSGNQDPSVHLWIPAENEELHMSGYESKVKHLAFDHTSHWLATGGGRDVCVWDCSGPGPEGREPAMLPHDAPVNAVAFQHAHGLLASASEDGVVMLWSPDRRQPLRATVKMPAPATKLSWSPDDRHLAIGTDKGTVYVLLAQ